MRKVIGFQPRICLIGLAAAISLAACKGEEVQPYYEGTADAGAQSGGSGGGGEPPTGGTGGVAGAPTPGGDTGGSQAGGTGGSGGEAVGGGQPEAVRPFDGEGACADDAGCDNGQSCVLGLCVKPAPRDFRANFACDDLLIDGSEPDFSCWDHPQAMAEGGPATVSMRGKIEFFGDGNVTKDLTVKVYDLATFDPSPCLTAGEGEAEIDRARAAIEACVDERNAALSETVSHICADNPTEGCYEMEGVPTGTELVIRVSGEARLWVPTYEYGVFVNPCVLEHFKDDSTCPEQRPEAAPDTNWSCSLKAGDDGEIYMPNDLNVLSKTTWFTFPPTAGVPKINLGNGAIAGRAYDCQGRPVVNAAVGLARPGPRTTYFNGNPDDTLPQPGLDRTNIDATYANLDTPPGYQGVVQVAWQGEGAERALKIVNFNRVYLLPNTLIILSPSGRNPADVYPPFH